MTLSVKHAKVVASADSGDGKVSTNAWNDEHVLKGTANMLVGFDGDGLATEIDPAGIGGSLITVTSYGALGDTILSAVPNGSGTATITSGTDDTAAIQAAIDYVGDTLGGGTVYFPEGRYKITSPLTAKKNVTLRGAGRMASFIVCAFDGTTPSDGSAFLSSWPSNSSTNAHIRLQSLGIHCPSATNKGAAFYDNCGTGIWLDDCFLSGFKYGVIFDQSEVAHLNNCFLWKQTAGGAGLWIVNGAALTVGNTSGFTNVISASRCQINQGASTYGILDEGGVTHSFVDNNYNGCLNHIYAAGASSLKIDGGEFEASSGSNIELALNRVSDGGAAGGCAGIIANATMSNQDTGIIHFSSSAGPVTIKNCVLSRADFGPPITGANNASKLILSGNLYNSTTQEAVDGYNAAISDTRIALNVRTNGGLSSTTLLYTNYNCFLQCTNVTSNTLTIQSDSAMGANPVPIGTVLRVEQTTAAGTVTLVAGSGATLTGVVATSAQYQCLEVRKTAANTWQSQLIPQKPLGSTLNLSDLASASTARTNLGLGSAALLASTAVAQTANNLSDIASAATARTNLGLATVASSGSASDLATGTLPAARLPAPQIQAVTSSATVTPTFSNDQVNITAQAVGLTLANPTGTAVDGWGVSIRIKDNGSAQTIAFGTQYRAVGVTLPTTTVAGKVLYLGMVYNIAATKWDVLAVAQEA